MATTENVTPGQLVVRPPWDRGQGAKPKYRAEMCEAVLQLGAQGDSKCQMAARFGVTRKTISRWEKTRPEFAEAMELAMELSQAWWETQGRDGMWAGKSFNSPTYQFNMKNRFRADYTDRQEVTLDASAAFMQIWSSISGGKIAA